jgi:hypothetical protein
MKKEGDRVATLRMFYVGPFSMPIQGLGIPRSLQVLRASWSEISV